MVLRRCRSLLKDEERAADAMQDVFVKVLRRREAIKNEGLSSFLYTTATNTCLNILRDESRCVVPADEGWVGRLASREEMEERVDNRLFLDDLFRGHRPDTRSMAVLHYRDGMTLSQTAEATGLSVSGVRKRLRKLRTTGLAMAGA
jgi:RNA polymerase sigma-70 factor (ECF subfamily)